MPIKDLSQSATLSLDSVVCAAADQISCDLGGEAAILNLKSGTYYGLDTVGAFIWNKLAEPQPVSAIAAAIIDQYEVDRERCEADLLVLLKQLDDRGLIEVRPNK
ncbi:MAG: PqqD family peptide modification chaperone [Candidatus Binataceae bacterium]